MAAKMIQIEDKIIQSFITEVSCNIPRDWALIFNMVKKMGMVKGKPKMAMIVDGLLVFWPRNPTKVKIVDKLADAKQSNNKNCPKFLTGCMVRILRMKRVISPKIISQTV
jgi:hypothetical protein